MTDQYITIKEEELWLVVPNVHPDYDDGFVTLRDDTGGDTLIHRDEIPRLLEELKKLVKDELNGSTVTGAG